MNSYSIRVLSLILHLGLYVPVTIGKCNTNEIECGNGSCILADQWCDGIIDCQDRSDEEKFSCLNITCPKFSFKCAYGACIDKRLKCNGNKDCHDGSDEASNICSNQQHTSMCLQSQYQCINLECIPTDNVCDGKADCSDGSDETYQNCGNIHCPKFSFQCEYGACIPSVFKCNGRKDCVDGTDEKDCDGIAVMSNRNKPEQSTNSTIVPIQPVSDKGCYVPKDDRLRLVEDITGDILSPGATASLATLIKYSCPKNTFLKGTHSTNFCDGETWLNPHPECIKVCPPLRGHTIKVLCTHNGKGVNCDRHVEPGTIAKVNCAVMYEKPQNRHVQEDLYCQSDGEWNYSPFKCEQICGTVDTKIPFSVGSQITQVLKVPWQVAIYLKSNAIYEHICGGTLIESKIVISAAHCFWNTKTSSLYDKSNYVVAAGKFYRDYYATNETELDQKTNVSKIEIPLQFRGGDYDFISDIAVLTLNNHIEYKNYIRPACLTWRSNNDKALPSDKLGIVAGWGITDTGTYSPDLRSVELFSIDSQTCAQKKITKNDRIANDKFCVETGDGKNVCKGDSGGGFLVPEDVNGVTYYHLWGVVSNGITSRNSGLEECNSEFITTFTNVQWYEMLIKTAIANVYSLI